MIRGVRIYIEGGGDGKHSKGSFRRGMQAFLQSLREKSRSRLRWNMIACGSRGQAFDMFCTAIQQHPDCFNILLVDSEGPVNDSPWVHLRKRDNWLQPDCTDGQCQLMVQLMETWFVADPDALARHFGQGFRRRKLPRHANVENIPKKDVIVKINKAVHDTSKKSYRKMRDGPRILELLNADTVRARASYCDRLFATIEELIDNSTQ